MKREFLKFRLESLTQMLADPGIGRENRRALESLRAQIQEELEIFEKSEPGTSGNARGAGSK